MKLVLFALTLVSLVGCTKTLPNYRETFEPTQRKGVWADEYRNALNHKDPNHPEKRALFRERE